MATPDFKIKTIPRPNEKAAPASAPKAKLPPKKSFSLAFIAMSLATLTIVTLGFYQHWKATRLAPNKAKASQQSQVQPVARNGASVTKYMHDTQIAELMMKRRTQLENQRTMGTKGSNDEMLALASDSDERGLGVQLDVENTSERIYEDLYGEKPTYADGLPEEKINNRLANRKWLNEMERAERLNFVKNFIRQAYDKGYEVQLDQNLVVVGVKRLNNTKQVNIDEVLNRLAKQGQ